MRIGGYNVEYQWESAVFLSVILMVIGAIITVFLIATASHHLLWISNGVFIFAFLLYAPIVFRIVVEVCRLIVGLLQELISIEGES